MIPGQLEFAFEGSLGTEEEAREIFEALGDRFLTAPDTDTPAGWKHLGSGGTRMAFLSPSGVVYKLEFDADDYDNVLEHNNFRKIKGKLPKGWRVPKSHLHVFLANMTKWDYNTRNKVTKTCYVSVLACEYIEGQLVGGWRNRATDTDKEVFQSVGLYDWHGANAVRTTNGTTYIIDAGEILRSELTKELTNA